MAPISSAARTDPAPRAERICPALCRASGLSLIAGRIAASIVSMALRFAAISVAIVLAAAAALIRALRLFGSESEIKRDDEGSAQGGQLLDDALVLGSNHRLAGGPFG
jgi:hypothetical protein